MGALAAGISWPRCGLGAILDRGGGGEGNEREIEGESEKGGLRGKWRVRATDAEEKTRLM